MAEIRRARVAVVAVDRVKRTFPPQLFCVISAVGRILTGQPEEVVKRVLIDATAHCRVQISPRTRRTGVVFVGAVATCKYPVAMLV